MMLRALLMALCAASASISLAQTVTLADVTMPADPATPTMEQCSALDQRYWQEMRKLQRHEQQCSSQGRTPETKTSGFFHGGCSSLLVRPSCRSILEVCVEVDRQRSDAVNRCRALAEKLQAARLQASNSAPLTHYAPSSVLIPAVGAYETTAARAAAKIVAANSVMTIGIAGWVSSVGRLDTMANVGFAMRKAMSPGATDAERLGAMASLANAGAKYSSGPLSSPITAGAIAAAMSIYLQASADLTASMQAFSSPESPGPYVSTLTLSPRYTSNLAEYERIDVAVKDLEQLGNSSSNTYIGAAVSRSSRGYSVEAERAAAARNEYDDEFERRRRNASNDAARRSSSRSSWMEFNKAFQDRQAGVIQGAQQPRSSAAPLSKRCREECVQRGAQIRCELQPATAPCYACARFAEVCD